MSLLGNILGGTGKNLIEGVGNAIDSIVSNPEEKIRAKAELTKVVMDNLSRLHEAQAQVIGIEGEGSKLQRNWRPIVMLSFAFIIVYSYFIEPVLSTWLLLPEYELPDQLFELLKLGLGGYIIGRSAEKVATTVVAGGGINLFKKKKGKSI